MSSSAYKSVTFAALDGDIGKPEPPISSQEDFPLPTWYRSVRHTPLAELTIEDLCKACRQQIHLPHVIPVAIKALQVEPLAGEMFDGELLAAMVHVDPDFWKQHSSHALALQEVLRNVDVESNPDLKTDLSMLLDRTEKAR